MLVLTRRINESIVIDDEIVVTVLEVGRNGQVRLGIVAPRHHQIFRQELLAGMPGKRPGASPGAIGEPPRPSGRDEPTPVGPQSTVSG